MNNKEDMRKTINLIENWIREESTAFEMTGYSIQQKDELQAQLKKVWPDVTYQGLDILEGPNSYYDQLEKLVEARVTGYNKEFRNYQESYLGYDMDKDVFYSGYDGDPWGDDSDYNDYEPDDEEAFDDYHSEMGGAVFMIKVVDGKLHILEHESTAMIYMETYRELHKRHPNLIDLRLD